VVGKVVLALEPLVVVVLVPMRGQCGAGRTVRDMVVDMVVVVVEVGVEEPCGGQCSGDG